MEQSMKIAFPNGEIFEVPLRIIAENRANYYAGIDGYEVYSNCWYDEIEYSMENPMELSDWLYHNMSWSDIEAYTTKISDDEDENGEELEYDDIWDSINIE